MGGRELFTHVARKYLIYKDYMAFLSALNIGNQGEKILGNTPRFWYNYPLLNDGEYVMSEVVKICKVHGNLTADQVYFCIRKDRPVGKEVRCAECRKITNAKKFAKKQAKVNALPKEEYIKYRDEQNRRVKEDRAANPQMYRDWENRCREKKKEHYQLREIEKRYGMTPGQYDQMLIAQNYKCEICKKEETRASRTVGEISRLCVDHCHSTGKIRSLLCHDCNTGIGKFKESIEIIDAVRNYLERHQT